MRRVIFFDLDDTLIPSEALYRQGEKAVWQALSRIRPMSWPRFQRLYSQSRAAVKAELGRAPASRNRVLYLKRFVEALLGRTDGPLLRDLLKAYHTAWRGIDPSGIHTMARRLSKRYALGILTNQLADFQLAKMARIDPSGRWFRWIVTSEEAGAEKPDPRMFALACRRAGCRPSEAVMVGDSWTGDILGARRAGLEAVFVGPRLPPGAKLSPGIRHARTLQEAESLLLGPVSR